MVNQHSQLNRLSQLNRFSQFLLLVAGGFTTALLIAVYLESQLAAIATWYFFYVLISTTLIWIIVFAIRNVHSYLSDDSHSENYLHESKRVPSENRDSDTLAILHERYARGELTDDQFEQKLDRLLETDTPENAAEWREASRNQSKEKSLK